MDSRLSLQIAQQHINDLRRSAAHDRHAEAVEKREQHTPVIAIRLAGSDEARELEQLADLDSAHPLRGETLVALVDGQLVAAIALASGRVIADPLAATAEARDLLHARAAQLAKTPKRPWRRFRPRFA
jgi:hypothetical protein